MGKFIDKIFVYLMIGSVLVVLILLGGLILDNFRIVTNMFLIFMAMLFSGFCVYEGINYINKKIKNHDNNK